MTNYCGVTTGPSGTYSIVENQIATLTSFASQAFSTAQAAVGALSAFSITFKPPQATFSLSASDVTPFQKPPSPEPPGISFQTPNPVSDPSLIEVNPISAGSAPTFTAAAPVISLPPRPGALSAERPGAPPTPTSIVIPEPPDDTIPALPTLLDYQLPVIEEVDLSALKAAFQTLWASRPALAYSGRLGDNYLSTFETLWPALLARQADYIGANSVNARVIAVIEEFLSGSIGVPAAVDAQYWAREYAELDRNVAHAERQAREDWSARGEPLPAGVLDFRLAYARAEATKARQGVVRERMIKRTEWMIQNYATVLSAGIGFLEMERKQWLAVNTLTETLARQAFEVAARVGEFDLKVKELAREYWKAQASVFDTWLRTELAGLEKTKLELDTQRLIGEINKDLLTTYKLRLEGIQTTYALYKDKIEALNLVLGADKLRFEGFESLVKAYSAEVAAWAEEWAGFGKAVDGELGRTKIYETLAGAFAERMKGYQIDQDTKRSSEMLKIETNRLTLDLFGKKIERFLGELRAESERINALVTRYQADTQVYAAENAAEASRIGSEIQALELDTRQGEARANISLKESEIAIQEMLSIKNLLLQAMDAIARTEANLAGSAMSAAHVSAGISNSHGQSTGCSTNYNVSIEQ